MKKYLYNFEQQSWREMRQKYFDLLTLIQNVDWLMEENAAGDQTKYIVDFLNSDSGADIRINYVDKHALSMLEIRLVDNFVLCLKDLRRWLESRNLSVIELREGVDNFVRINKQLSEQEKREIRKIFSDFEIVMEDLRTELELIIVILGKPQIVFPYSFEEFGKLVFEGVGEIEDERLFATLTMAKYDDKDGYRFVKSIVNFLATSTEKDDEEMEWKESLLLFLMLDLVYYRFDRLVGVERWFLLQNYFYKAIVCGLPVREILQNYLRNCDSMFDFLIKCSELKDCLVSNKENVLISIEKKEKKSLIVLLNNLIVRISGDEINSYKLGEFVKEIYKQEAGRDAFMSWLIEAFFIMLHVNNADLVDWKTERDVAPDEKAAEDRVKLLFYVGFGGPMIPHLIDYLKNKENKVSFNTFLITLKENIDLTDEKMVDKIFDLTKSLKENYLLDENHELIEFHELDNKFHWNEDIFK